MAYKKKIAIAKIQFTFKGTLYKIGDEFKGKKKSKDSLINKNIIKWQ